MTVKRRSIRFSVISALLVAAGISGLFFLMTTVVDFGALHFDVSIDPATAVPVTFVLVGFYSFFAIVCFPSSRRQRGRTGGSRLEAAFSGVEALMTREPRSYALAMAPIHGFVFAATVFLWKALSPAAGAPAATGAPDSVWAEYAHSPLPFFVVAFALTSAMYCGLAVSALVAAVIPRLSFATFFVFLMSLVGIGVGIGVWQITTMSIGPGLLLTLPATGLSAAALLAARRVTRTAIGRLRDISAEARDRFPPEDILRKGESILIALPSRISLDPRFFVVTDQRFLSVVVWYPADTQIVESARPDQLTGGSAEESRRVTVTTAHFRDRSDMTFVGDNAAEAHAFARTLNHLAQHRTLPD